MSVAEIRHAFVSLYPDGPDTARLQPSDWNALLLFTGGNTGELLQRDPTSLSGAAWVAPSAFAAAAGSLTGTTLAANVVNSSLTSFGSSLSTTGAVKTGDGTAALPAYSFTSEPTLGLWRNAAGNVTMQGALSATGVLYASAPAGGGLVVNNPTADAGVTGQAYLALQTAGTNRWYVGMSANGSTGNFDVYNNISTVNALSIHKTTSRVSVATGIHSADGTALLPAFAFTSEPTLGFWRSAAGNVTLQGVFTATSNINSGGRVWAANGSYIGWPNGTLHRSPTDGVETLNNGAETIGVRLKFDALPTIASGFGGSPAVTAGSTPFAGSVNVGTGGASSSGVINFNGIAFPSAPFVVALNQTTGLAVKATASATQLTISTATGNFGVSDVISWVCISSK